MVTSASAQRNAGSPRRRRLFGEMERRVIEKARSWLDDVELPWLLCRSGADVRREFGQRPPRIRVDWKDSLERELAIAKFTCDLEHAQQMQSTPRWVAA